MQIDAKKLSIGFSELLLICVVLSILVSFYYFYVKKEFNFIVEVPCDQTKESCFHRDCSKPDDCPPNGLSEFKRYSLNAVDFNKCKDENCSDVCARGEIKCVPVACSEDKDTGESCSFRADPAPNKELR